MSDGVQATGTTSGKNIISSGDLWSPEQLRLLEDSVRGVETPDWNDILAKHGDEGTIDKLLSGRSVGALQMQAYKKNFWAGTRMKEYEEGSLRTGHDAVRAGRGGVDVSKACSRCKRQKPVVGFLPMDLNDPLFAMCAPCRLLKREENDRRRVRERGQTAQPPPSSSETGYRYVRPLRHGPVLEEDRGESEEGEEMEEMEEEESGEVAGAADRMTARSAETAQAVSVIEQAVNTVPPTTRWGLPLNLSVVHYPSDSDCSDEE